MVHKILVWILVVALTLPASLTGCVSRNGEYRADAPTARGAMAKSEDARGEGGEMIPPPSPLALSPTSPHYGVNGEAVAETDISIMGVRGNHSPAGSRAESWPPEASSAAARPRGLNEALFNAVASFVGLPGLAPQRGVDGSLDEGLGFHQDGTVRRAGSDNDFDGQRARAYQRAGLGTGLNGNGLGVPYYPDRRTATLWRDDDLSGRRDARNRSRSLDDLNPFDMAMERGLNYGMGLLNSAGEAALSGLADNGRARLNFQMNRDGRLSGEGDVLLPLYDGRYTTLFTQLGARSMDVNGGEDDGSQRWIGNFGLGQRWFPLAESLDDAGNLMLGYNVFFDNDFTRSHQRGGAGVEAQYDWFHMAANYYTPLSGWKASRDFDGDFVEERPARGWDARLKAYLPFYRNVALTGAYSQWYGDHVGMYGSSDDLEKDPRVWSYGVEYTPVPLVSGFVKQRSTERGKTDTEFGLQFTYHFGMSWEEQISYAKVAELRSVSGSRHEFVDRENRIILEYRAKNSYHIEYLGQAGSNVFRFRIRNGFDEYVAGQIVRVSAGNGVTLAEAPTQTKTFLARAGEFLDGLFSVQTACAASNSMSYTTDGRGEFVVRVNTAVPGSVVLTIQAGGNTQSFTVNATGGISISLANSTPNPDVSGSSELTATVTEDGVAVSGETVVFTWKIKGGSQVPQAGATVSTDANGVAKYTLSNSLDSYSGSRRTITVTATVQSDTSKTAWVNVQFGADLPTGFIAYAGNTKMNWKNAKEYCTAQGGKLPNVKGSDPWNGSVDGFGDVGSPWPSDLPTDAVYWTDTEVSGSVFGFVWVVGGLYGNVNVGNNGQSYVTRVACVSRL